MQRGPMSLRCSRRSRRGALQRRCCPGAGGLSALLWWCSATWGARRACSTTQCPLQKLVSQFLLLVELGCLAWKMSSPPKPSPSTGCRPHHGAAAIVRTVANVHDVCFSCTRHSKSCFKLFNYFFCFCSPCLIPLLSWSKIHRASQHYLWYGLLAVFVGVDLSSIGIILVIPFSN